MRADYVKWGLSDLHTVLFGVKISYLRLYECLIGSSGRRD